MEAGLPSDAKLKGRVTSLEVARRAGVSQSAVSRTFTPGASVAPATREKVVEAARDLGYRPNAIARSLITSRSRIIGVAMGYLDNHFYPEVLEALTSLLQNRGYQVLLFTGFQEREADPGMMQILQYQVDGLILASTTLSSELAEQCAAAGVPIVLFNRTTDRAAVSSVTSDNRLGGERAADFLLAAGHKSFAYVAGIAGTSTNRDREAGFRKRLKAAGIAGIVKVDGFYSHEGAEQAARTLFARKDRPDAVFCANDHMALAVIDVARFEFHLGIPEDVSIVGYDNAGPARWSGYSLTSVEQPVGQMVDATIDMLMKQIDGNAPGLRQQKIRGDLIVRSSARIPDFGVVEEDGRQLWRPPDLSQRHAAGSRRDSRPRA
jgi:DNA-binding LacI/PurR family transcriptional regulator